MTDEEVIELIKVEGMSPTTVVLESPYSAICSVGQAPFWGTLVIEYAPRGSLLEFESFERWLDGFALRQVTIEELAGKVFDTLRTTLGKRTPLRVILRAETTKHGPVQVMIEGDWDV